MSVSSRKSHLIGPTQLAAPQNLTPAAPPVTIREVLQPIILGQLPPSVLDILRDMDTRQTVRMSYPLLSPLRTLNPRVYESIQPILNIAELWPIAFKRDFDPSIAAGATENETQTVADLLSQTAGTGESAATRRILARYVDIGELSVQTSLNTTMTEQQFDGANLQYSTHAANVQRLYIGNQGFQGLLTNTGIPSPGKVRVYKRITWRFVNAGAGAETQNIRVVGTAYVDTDTLEKILAAVT